MCYKYATPTLDDLLAYLADQPEYSAEDYKRYFVADGFTFPQMPVTTAQEPNKIQDMQWGLLPHWVSLKREREKFLEAETKKFEKKGKPFDASLVKMPEDEKLLKAFQTNTLNARAEEVFIKPSWKMYIMKQRCIIYASGFFESRHFNDGKVKIPYFIYPQQYKLLQFGGIWNAWINTETGEIRNTFTIITVPANTLMSKIHNSKLRMPLILSREQTKQWLSPIAKEDVIEMMTPCGDTILNAHTIDALINKQVPIEEKNRPEILQEVLYPEWVKD